MIINIPVQVNEQSFEDAIRRDYEGKLFIAITEEAKKAIASKSNKYYGDRVADGLLEIAAEQVCKIIKDHEDEIIDKAAKELAERLARSRKGKAILEEIKGK